MAGLFIYAPAFHGTWLWDDDQEITASAALPDVQGGLGKIWRGESGADYLPLKSTVQWVLFRFIGANEKGEVNPTGWHLANVILHLLNAFLVWRLFAKLRIPQAWVGGLIFCIHPILVESVAWVSELKNTLSLPFLLGAMMCYINYDERGRTRDIVLAIVFYVAAILCKSAVIMFPVVLLLYAWWRGKLVDWKGVCENAQPLRWLAGVLVGLVVAVPLSFIIRFLFDAWKIVMSDFFFVGPLKGMAVANHAGATLAVLFILCAVTCAFLGALIAAPRFTRWAWANQLWFASIPFFVISLIVAVVTIYFQFGRAIGSEIIPLGSLTTWEGFTSRVAIAGMAMVFYFWKTVVPFGLMPIYPRWEVIPAKASQFLAWPLVGAVLFFLWTKRKTWGRHALFGVGFFLVNLVPVLGFVTMSYMRITWVADHFLYLPALGLIGLATAGIGVAYERVDIFAKRCLLAAGLTAFFVLTTYSHFYAGIFEGEETMWKYNLARNDEAWQAHSRLGKTMLEKADQNAMRRMQEANDAAFYHIGESVRLRPDLAETHNNYGAMMEKKGNYDEAVRQLRMAVERAQDVNIYKINLAGLLMRLKRNDEAAEVYQALLKGDPNNPAFLCNYGVAQFFLGHSDEAIASFKRALEINPNLTDARQNLQQALQQKAASSPGGTLLNPTGNQGGGLLESSTIKLGP